MYADDTCFVSSATTSETALLNSQSHINTLILPYMRDNKLSINTSKTEYLLLRRKAGKNSLQLQLCIDGQYLTASNTLKYLGYTVHRYTNANAHIAQQVSKAKIAMSQLYLLICKHSNLSTTNNITIYKHIIRPILT